MRFISLGNYERPWQDIHDTGHPESIGWYAIDGFQPGQWRPGVPNQTFDAVTDRLVAGQRLEQALTTTPKPLITLTHGLLHVGTDWRPIVWATLVVHGAVPETCVPGEPLVQAPPATRDRPRRDDRRGAQLLQTVEPFAVPDDGLLPGALVPVRRGGQPRRKRHLRQQHELRTGRGHVFSEPAPGAHEGGPVVR